MKDIIIEYTDAEEIYERAIAAKSLFKAGRVDVVDNKLILYDISRTLHRNPNQNTYVFTFRAKLIQDKIAKYIKTLFDTVEFGWRDHYTLVVSLGPSIHNIITYKALCEYIRAWKNN